MTNEQQMKLAKTMIVVGLSIQAAIFVWLTDPGGVITKIRKIYTD
jgi:hypothetical protein